MSYNSIICYNCLGNCNNCRVYDRREKRNRLSKCIKCSGFCYNWSFRCRFFSCIDCNKSFDFNFCRCCCCMDYSIPINRNHNTRIIEHRSIS